MVKARAMVEMKNIGKRYNFEENSENSSFIYLKYLHTATYITVSSL
jgi:hypothetical protein